MTKESGPVDRIAKQPTYPRGRKPYHPPQISRVVLVPDEAILGMCKNVGAGPMSSNCSVSQCTQLGT